MLDILYIDHEDGKFRFAEVKNGPYADFSATQKQRYGEVNAGNWIPYGPRAIGANLLPGVSMGGIPGSQWGGMNYMHFHGEPRTSIWNRILNGR